jgi:hypothetical protein
MANRGGFSWKRATGVTRTKQRISRSTGIPMTKSGRQRKVGKAVTGGGCLLPAMVALLLGSFALSACTAPSGGLDNRLVSSPLDQIDTPTRTTSPKRTPKSVEVYYKNCSAARAAGAAPVHRGDPGYRPALDRDGDGVGCE